ncbi:MAG: hypothetical protein HY851_02445 [candidate division Zixibacteria bacterium]|nr:hypothetical protein [candidate division Zixibacteria bacterium]
MSERYIGNWGSTNCGKFAVLVLLFGLLIFGTASAQEVSTEVLPSEDELLDALINGEIEYDVYLTLTDLLINGVDTSQLYMFDNIPGLPAPRSTSRRSLLENEQVRALVGGNRPPAGGQGSIRYRYGQELEDAGRGRYRAVSRYALTPNIEGALSMAREYSGRERILSRSLDVRFDSSNIVRRMTLGSFRERFGLGTAIGYRGKLLSSSNQLNGESMLVPDWGGYNGVRLEMTRSGFNSTVLASYNRDSSHTLFTLGARGTYRLGAVNPTAILATHRLANRQSGTRVSVYNAAVNLSGDGDFGRYALEICSQTGWQKAEAIVIETEFDRGPGDIMLSGWAYSRRFLDLASGSRAAGLSRTEEIEPVDFQFARKRAGQFGALVKTKYQLGTMTRLLLDGMIAARVTDTSTAQGLFGVEHRISSGHALRGDIMYKSNVRLGEPEKVHRRGRIEWQWQASDWRARSAVGFTNESSSGEYWSLVVSITRSIDQNERWQIWSNWRRISHGHIDYWYGYLSFMQPFQKRISGGVKFSDTYNRSSVNHHSPALTLELAVQL